MEDINNKLKQELMKIKPANNEVFAECKDRWNSIAKPLNGFGRLEELVCRIGAIQGCCQVRIRKKCAIIMCSDNGVIEEGVSQTDESVTAIVAKNLTQGMANVNICAGISGTDVIPVNIGMKSVIREKGLIDRCVRCGTDNISKGPAMSREECIRAILYGIEMAGYAKMHGYDIIATGEMGIGNTTTSSAIASILLNLPVGEVTGRGAGLSDAGLKKKIEVIEAAVKVNNPDRNDAIDLISKLGGFDIAGMTGLFLGGGVYGIPVVIDGLISTVSAILADMLNHNSTDYMIPSHMGREPACEKLLDMLSLKPFIYADMALGEGTGAVSVLPLIDMALRVYSQNITFDDINMDAYKPL